MSKTNLKILFFSDTHLGFDYPIKPRLQRRRRGDDFFSNYHQILETAKKEKVDLIIHGGDLFFRSKVPNLIIEKTFSPLVEVANSGIPIYLVPGNHERSKFPGYLWLAHKNIHVFNKPKTFWVNFGESTIVLSGFPFTRRVKHHFKSLLQQTRYLEYKAKIHLLCIHQTVEGAKVGPSDFTFRVGEDNIPGLEIPPRFTAVLSGHIHRGQILDKSLDQYPLATPVIYPGSIERTSFAERFEDKFYVILKFDLSQQHPKPIIKFHPLPTRSMVKIEIDTGGLSKDQIKRHLQNQLATLDPNSIVRIQFTGPNAEETQNSISADQLRKIAPSAMNASIAYPWAPRKKI
jgi:exonuclease SbcD